MLRYVEHSGHDRVFIFDHKLEFLERLKVRPSYRIDELLERVKAGEKFLSYCYIEEWPGDSENAFQFFCQWVHAICRELSDLNQKTLLACDEVNRFIGTGDMGDGFKVAIEDGRLQGLDFMGTSHAANQIHNRLRLQLTEIVALKTQEKLPLEFLEDNGFDPEAVRNLNTGEYICKNTDTDVFIPGRVFSCARADPAVEANSTGTSQPPPQYAISTTPADTIELHGHSAAGGDDQFRHPA